MRYRYRVGEFLKYIEPDLYSLPFNGFHRTSLALQSAKAPWEERQGVDDLRAVAAPRGIAKTTLLKGELIHDVVYGLERVEVVLSAEMRLARSITRHLFQLFSAEDSRLARLYGPFVVEGGIDEFTVRVGKGRPVGFLARSFGTPIRGANFNGQRPTRINIDDGERKDRVKNADQRRIWWDFLQEDILKSGPRVGGLIADWRGTVLHPDSVLAQLLKHDAWTGARYQALLTWPTRTDLWEECRKVWADLRLGAVKARRAAAYAFYEKHRAEMDRGAQVLDTAALPLFRFYETIWQTGLASVLKDLQNEPRSSTTKVFDSTAFQRCRLEGDVVVAADGHRVKVADLRIGMYLDPIPGKELGTLGDDGGAGGGDFACIPIIGREYKQGRPAWGYVLDAWMRRARDSEILQAMWQLGERWRVHRGSIESNGFQRLITRDFRRMQQERRQKGLWADLIIEEDTSTTAKEDRIASLEVPITHGWLQFATHLPQPYFQQFDDFPDGDHDDGPDATEGAWRLTGGPALTSSPTPLPGIR